MITTDKKQINKIAWLCTITYFISYLTRLNFGAVVTLREIKGVNRIEEFKHACLLRGYIVTELEARNQIEIYETSQEEVIFQ